MAQDSSLIKKIKYNVLFDSVEESLLEELAPHLKETSFKTGETIFNEDSEGSSLYLLLSGCVKVSTTTTSGDEIIFGVLHAGDFFGELELVDDRPRSATATVINDCTVVALGREHFKNLLKSNHPVTLNLLRMLSLRLRTMNQTFVLKIEQHLKALQNQLTKVHNLIEATKIVNSTLDADKLLELILQTACSTVSADRGTLYIFDEAKNELWSKILQGSSKVEIRLPMGKGIAGYVGATGETINIPDAYVDSRFNPAIDKTTGYHTKTILCMPMKNKDGKIIGVFQLLNKLQTTFTKEDEELIDALSIHASIAIENARMAQQMVSNERLSAVGRMASTIIHDIKNPMGTLRVYAQVIRKKTKDEEAIKMADEMIRQVDRFVNMTQEILDFSRGVSSMNIQEVEFDDLITMVLTFIEKDLVKRSVQLIKNLQYKGIVKVDQDKLMRVFYNIAGNAADAMPNGGQLKVNTFKRNETLVIEFIDTGTGMPPEIKAKVFEPFVTYGKKHGTGLGMAIVKKIIDDHKGKIEIDSEMGKGTTVRLLLPVN